MQLTPFLPRLALLLSVLLLASCATTTKAPKYKGPLTQAQAVDLARQATIKMEHWPKGQIPDTLIEVLICKAAPPKDGAWTVTVRQGLMEKKTRKTAIIPGSKRLVVVSPSGQVTGYASRPD
ncbi:MAG: hypothetical protein U0984_12585 [Prosthecobacter sp.]|nr:hypothetical protein [Prosthecobacter sp.]